MIHQTRLGQLQPTSAFRRSRRARLVIAAIGPAGVYQPRIGVYPYFPERGVGEIEMPGGEVGDRIGIRRDSVDV